VLWGEKEKRGDKKKTPPRPNIFLQRASFERSEKQPVNRKNRICAVIFLKRYNFSLTLRRIYSDLFINPLVTYLKC
jgi:hypothetical protein